MDLSTSSETLLARAGAIGAMVICFAVVLGVGRMSREETAAAHTAAHPAFTSAETASAPADEHQDAEQPLLLPVAHVAELNVVEPIALQAHALRADAPEPRAETATMPLSLSPSAPAPAPAPPPPAPPSSLSSSLASPFDDTFLGVWAPDASSCTLRDFRQDLLPTIINDNGAWAGETFCAFRNPRRTAAGWQVVATCSNADERWTTPVNLKVKGDRLTWVSKRGTQVYTRCAPGLRMTASQ
jgi:hypothetical protein